jgi:TolB-like protein/Tfp pilus assembly protein PilF
VSGNDQSFFTELKRRNVYRVAIAYVIASWLFLQVLELVVSLAGAPEWIGKLSLGVLLMSLPLVLVLSWVYELTPEGIKREKDVDRDTSITPQTGSRLDQVTLGIFVVAVVWIIADRTVLSPATPIAAESTNLIQEEVVATVAVDKSIAVLPFMNMSEDTSAGHFSDGLADTVLHKLAQVNSLRVVARNSSFQFRGQNVDIREVGEQLNVSNVLEGSVQASGNKIRVTAQLIQAETGFHLWSGNFDRELDDVFAIQDEIAEKVVDALQISLGDADAARLIRRDTESVEAFREYSLALRELDEFSFESLPRALEHINRAISIDPDYALAWATKGLVYRYMRMLGATTDQVYTEAAKPAVQKALQLNADLPLALALHADLERREKRPELAWPLIEKAVRLAPNDAVILRTQGEMFLDELKPDRGLEIARKALELDPLSVPAHQALAGLLRSLDQQGEALELAKRMQVLNPEAPSGWWTESYMLTDSGEWARAVMTMIEAHEIDPLDPITTMDVAWYTLTLGLDDIARAWINKSREIDSSHPQVLIAGLLQPRGEAEFDQETVRLARKILIEAGRNRFIAGNLAFLIMQREAYRTDYFDEFLAWARHFHPETFDPTIDSIDSIDEDLIAMISIGRAMLRTDEAAQGQRIIDLTLLREQAVINAFKTAPEYDSFFTAAATGDRDRALQTLESMRNFTKLDIAMEHYTNRQTPWIREYWAEQAYQQFEANLERRVAEQRQLLLELNGGEYPLPD